MAALLRLTRSRSKVSFEALDQENLPLFLAAWQGLVHRGHSIEHLQTVLEKLFGCGLPTALWESDVLPARLDPYIPAWLDSLMAESPLMWLGCGKKRVTFCFEPDLSLFGDKTPRDPAPANSRDGARGSGEAVDSAGEPVSREVGRLFPDTKGKYSFWAIADHSGVAGGELTKILWRHAWEGSLSNDTFGVIRRGIESGFKATDPPPARSHRRRSGFSGWRVSRPLSGNWFLLTQPASERDALEQEELIRDRIAVLFDRYGIVFREILVGEMPALRWSTVFRSLRIMELSGEILSGQFFKGIRGIQFITPAALRFLKDRIDRDAVYWMNAADPASLCGIAVEGLKARLPARMPTTHLVFHGQKLALVSRKMGENLEFKVCETDPNLARYCAFFRALLNRPFDPPKQVRVTTINGHTVEESPYRSALISAGFTADYRRLILRPDYAKPPAL